MQTKSITPILAIVVVLAVVASALAMWYDMLKIAVTVNTGEVDVEFSPPTVEEFESKDVATCTAMLENVEEEGPDDNDLDLIIEISNGYPGYKCKVTFDVTNVGTIPVHGPFRGTDLSLFPAFELMDLDEDGNADIKVTYGLSPAQIHPNGSEYFRIEIEVLQDASEDAEYSFQLYLYFIQWNEAPITITQTMPVD
ncbi:MAG: hypothetical protein QW775_07830 [Ignisphaera sp.]|uniref:Uncharacterized protein n=1 Tax=Ignisphaera aggregans TaxID=334771 RepID=A0A7C4JKD0_9CREN